jgi:hypothetical protein
VYTDEEVEADLAALDSAAVAAAMDEVLRSAIVLGPSGCPAPDPDLRALTPTEPEPVDAGYTFTAFSRKGKLSRRAKGGASITISDRGVTWRSAEGEPGTLLWDQIVAVIRKPSGALILHQRDGTWLEVPAFGWDAETPFERLREVMPADCEIPVCDQERFDAIAKVAEGWLSPGDGVWMLVDDLPGILGSEERLLDLVFARQKLTGGLLVVTDKRVLWLTFKEDKGFEVPTGQIANAYAANDQLELYWDGNVAKLVIEPAEATSGIAYRISQLRTEPDR